MKRLLYIPKSLLYLCLAAVILSCGQREPMRRVGVSQCSAESWRWKTNDEIEREALFHNTSVEIRSADDKNEQQIADIRHFIEEGVDIIIANPNEEEALTPVLTEAVRKGIPVITFDRSVKDGVATTHIESDNEAIGREAARYALTSLLPYEGGKILEFQGDPSMSPTHKRHKGFADEIAKHPQYTIAASPYGKWNPDTTAAIALPLLKANPDVALVYCHSDVMAITVAKIAKSLGMKNVRCIGIDGNPQVGIKAVADGVIDATFIYPTYGYRLLQTADSIMKGYKVAKKINIPGGIPVDRSYARILLNQDSLLKGESEKIYQLKGKMDMVSERYATQTTLFYAIIAISLLLACIIFLLWRAISQNRKFKTRLESKNRQLAAERDKQHELNDLLQQEIDSKQTFYTNVAHDLRTPLTLICEPLDALTRDPEGISDDERDGLIAMACRNSRILTRLINQILDLNKIEAGQMKLHATQCHLPMMLQEWTDSFRPLAKKRGITINTSITPDPEPTLLDLEKIERVFFNLMSNAIKHTPAGGSITISSGHDADGTTVEVSDTGTGIPADEIERIFDRFYQVDRQAPRGSGIGLSLSKAFVELHGGSMSAQSAVGEGSVFAIRIPRKPSGGAEVKMIDPASLGTNAEHNLEQKEVMSELDTAPAIESAVDTSKPLLLAIDDNPDILYLLYNLLSDEWNIITATDGDTGFKKAAEILPDLVISDIMMPGLSGTELCRRLKTEKATSHIPVMLLTARGMDSDKTEGYDCGADSYLTKPFDAQMLRARCRNLLQNRIRIRDLYATGGIPEREGIRKQSGKNDSAVPMPEQIENEFYRRFVSIVKRELGNSELKMEQIASELCLGQAQLARKIKALTGKTPVELVRDFRLLHARELLTSTSRSITEIGIDCGFNLAAYFTRCYRETFGETPTETRNKATGQNS